MRTGTLTEVLRMRRPLVLDGAMGTELGRRGYDIGLPLWSAAPLLSAPEAVRHVHTDHVSAGADILTANTFRTTARTFRRAGKQDRSAELTALAVRLAREAASAEKDRRMLVAGSMAPLEDCYRTDLVPPDAELEAEHLLHARRLTEAGVDFILIETMGTAREATVAAAAAAATGSEFALSFLCSLNGTLYDGTPLADAVRAVLVFRPVLLGANCVSPRVIDIALRVLTSATPIPLFAYANVGVPGAERSDTMTVHTDPEDYGRHAARWTATGTAVIGGCCGTTPDHIRAVVKALQNTRKGAASASPAGPPGADAPDYPASGAGAVPGNEASAGGAAARPGRRR